MDVSVGLTAYNSLATIFFEEHGFHLVKSTFWIVFVFDIIYRLSIYSPDAFVGICHICDVFVIEHAQSCKKGMFVTSSHNISIS